MQNFKNNYSSKLKTIILLIIITSLIFYGRNIKRINFEIVKYGYSPLVKPFFPVDENIFRFDKQVKALIINYNNCNKKNNNDCLIMNPKIENFRGTIDYFFEGKKRKYFPDFIIKEKNIVVEVKSLYTYEIEREQNEAKKEATINSGFNFMFIIDKNYDSLD